MAEEKAFKENKLSLHEDNEILRPPPRRKKSLKKSKMDAEKSRENIRPLVVKDKKSDNQGAKSANEVPTEDSVGVLPVKETRKDDHKPHNVDSSKDLECEKLNSIEQKCTNDIPEKDSKAEKQLSLSLEHKMATETRAVAINENRNLHFENEPTLSEHGDMGNKNGSSRSTLHNIASTNGRESEMCANQRQPLHESSSAENVAITDSVGTFCWVDGSVDSKEIPKPTPTTPGQDSNFTQAKNTEILNESGAADTECVNKPDNTDVNQTLHNGNVGNDVKNSEMEIGSGNLSSKETVEGNSNFVGPLVKENAVKSASDISIKDETLSTVENNLSLSSTITEENTITISETQETKSTTPESELTISKGTTENTDKDIADISTKTDKNNTNNQDITKEKSESSIPYQNLDENVSCEGACGQWEDDNISTDTDSDIFYSDWSSSDEGEDMYNIELAEKLYGVSNTDADQNNSLPRRISSSDPVSEILSAFGPNTEYLLVDDKDTYHDCNQGDDNLGDGIQSDQNSNDLDLSEDRANSLKRKIGSFKVVKKTEHVVGNDVVKKAAVAIPTDSYAPSPETSNSNDANEAEKAIQALHKEFLKHVHHDSKSETRKSKERIGESTVYFMRAATTNQESSSERIEVKLEISRPRSIYGEPRLQRSFSTGDIMEPLNQNMTEGCTLPMRTNSWNDENEVRLNSLHVHLRGIIGSLGHLEDSRERRDSGSPLFKHPHTRHEGGLEMVAEMGSEKLDAVDGIEDVSKPCVSGESTSVVFEDAAGPSAQLLSGDSEVKDPTIDESQVMENDTETEFGEPRISEDNTSEAHTSTAQSPPKDKAVKDLTINECGIKKELGVSERPLSMLPEEDTPISGSSRGSSISQHWGKPHEDALQNESEGHEKNVGVEGATPIITDEGIQSADNSVGIKDESLQPIHESTPKRPCSLKIQSELEVLPIFADDTESASVQILDSKDDSSTSNNSFSMATQPNQSGVTKQGTNDAKKNSPGDEVKLRKIRMSKGRRPFSAVEPRNIPSSPTEDIVMLTSFQTHVDSSFGDTQDSGEPDINQSDNIEVAEEAVEETNPKRPPRTKAKLKHSASFAFPSREKVVKGRKNTKNRSRWPTLSEADWLRRSRLSPAKQLLDHMGPVTLVTDALPASIPNFPTHKRALVALELYTTERTYVRGLETVIELFKSPLEGYLDSKELEVMFSNITGIFQINKDVLFTLCEKVTHWNDEQMIGDVFVDMAARFKIYASYCTNYVAAETLIKQKIRRKKDFEAFLNACYNDPVCLPGLTLQAYLITVVQRIPRYLMLLRDLAKCTPAHHPDAKMIKEGIEKMNNIAEYINNQLQTVQGQQAMAELRSRVIGIKAFETPGRSLIKEGEIDLTSTKRTYKCLLFNDMIVFAAKNVNKHSEVELTLELKTLWVCDLDDNDPQTNKDDAIELYTPERSYTMYAGTRNEKKLWLQKLKTAIAIQLLGEEATESSEIATRKASYTFKDERIYCGFFIDSKTHGHGVLAWPNRTRYVGDFEDGERNGTGELIYNTGERYKGEWKDDKQHGNGTLTYPNGDVYTGEWKEGKMHGQGLIKFSNDDVLKGDFVDGEICGRAKLECNNNLFYEGTWKHSKKHGEGKLLKPNGDTYEGEFLNDRIHGQGKMVYAKTKATYDGQWENNHRHGTGTSSIPNGAHYVGEWSSDHIQGRGEMVYGNGEVYEGCWFRDMRFGKGRFRTHEGVYDGHFEYNLRHRFGIMQYKDGSEYEGEWQNDQREGQGKMIYADSRIYEGNWFHNLRHGRGKIIYPNRATYEGTWDLDSPHGSDGVYVNQASSYSYKGDWDHGRKEGRGVETTAIGSYEGDFKTNMRHGKGVETLNGGIVFEGKWRDNRKVGEGVRRTKWGNNETTEIQQWKEGQLLNKDESVAPDLPFLQRH